MVCDEDCFFFFFLVRNTVFILRDHIDLVVVVIEGSTTSIIYVMVSFGSKFIYLFFFCHLFVIMHYDFSIDGQARITV